MTIDKVDNTAPTITEASFSNNKLSAVAYDRHSSLGEGSDVSKYMFVTSESKLTNPVVNQDNGVEFTIGKEIVMPNIDKVRYVYVVVEDLVGNVSGVYEVEVPQLELTSEVDLDWPSYDNDDKYFMVYCKG